MKQEKKKNIEKENSRGETGFNSYYGNLFGQRWDALKKSLLEEVTHEKLFFTACEPYFLDPASVCAALCLPVVDADQVLDLCAAPGGKTLVLSGNLKDDATLFSNERSPERKNRLTKVIQTCLPETISSRVKISCSDGALWCKKQSECYDAILLDAPCSSERHVLTDKKYLDDWSCARIKTVSMEQWALLSSAFRLLKKEGFLLYATCALPPAENDEQIKRLLKKFPDAKKISAEETKEVFLKNLEAFKGILCDEKEEEDSRKKLAKLFEKAEKTEEGFHLLPDTSGAGPLYFSLVKKIDV